MHIDEEHEVTITQTHRATIDQTSTYTLDAEDYLAFLQLDQYDTFAREEFILQHGRAWADVTDVVDIHETTDVVVADLT